ncbi:hypothetical protein NSZ01_32770 [Nocardioides szechwanensis]|uniref:Glycosyl transferases group 1 n=1 Tax=Nocardioides szechwanensis TaxID=1005944 RepID=A0A1H0KHS4_9ACTN|nr:glycosyltransferase [Nocardioides szechwanensis]GEP35509.1 hypothetical protein NSZ01_32770 [Nocardioides szechwanensis]SDO55477.1 hypothetical protein SAMN05192576_0038 [Nocardioides szechwanensis]
MSPRLRRRRTADPVEGAALGVNLAGYFTGELGVGELGRLLVEATERSGLPFTTRVHRRTRSRQDVAFEETTGDPHQVTVAVVNADQFPQWVEDAPDLHRDRYVIGVWAWEVERFPAYADAFALVDEVWTLSQHNRRAVARRTDKPVRTVPLPTRVPEPAPPLDLAALGLPEGPYMLTAFDHLSVFDRKNPLGLVEAFGRAFVDGEGPTLVVKAINGHLKPEERDLLRAAAARRRDVHLLEQYVGAAELGALMDGCQSYASLHRAEGYGLTLAEAMVRGRPVVATGYSGNLDFMDESTALLVPASRVPIGPGHRPYPPQAQWGEPDLDAAAAHLRWVHEHPSQAEELGERARAHHLATRTLDRTAAFVRQRITAAVAHG